MFKTAFSISLCQREEKEENVWGCGGGIRRQNRGRGRRGWWHNASFHYSIITIWLVTHKTPYSLFLKPTEEFYSAYLLTHMITFDDVRILRKRLSFASNSWCFDVCTNWSETSTHCFVSVEDDLRNSTKQLRKNLINQKGLKTGC